MAKKRKEVGNLGLRESQLWAKERKKVGNLGPLFVGILGLLFFRHFWAKYAFLGYVLFIFIYFCNNILFSYY